LSADELLRQLMHVIICYESIGIRIYGLVMDAGGNNARLAKLLRPGERLGEAAWLASNSVKFRNPYSPSRFAMVWFCTPTIRKQTGTICYTRSSMAPAS
jgi:hypothetical protein